MTNKINVIIKTATCLLLFISVGTLSGCDNSGNNPLATTPKSTAVKFLESAAKSADNSLKFGWNQYGYQQCMDGQHSTNDCNALFQKMLTYAKSNRLYSNLTIAQLTDQTVWKTLKDQYQETAFDDFGN